MNVANRVGEELHSGFFSELGFFAETEPGSLCRLEERDQRIDSGLLDEAQVVPEICVTLRTKHDCQLDRRIPFNPENFVHRSRLRRSFYAPTLGIHAVSVAASDCRAILLMIDAELSKRVADSEGPIHAENGVQSWFVAAVLGEVSRFKNDAGLCGMRK
jgi:hypothetical protein